MKTASLHRFVSALCVVLTLSSMTAFSGYAFAQQNNGNQEQHHNANIDRNEAVERVQQAIEGRVLRVDQDKKKYRVKVLKKSGRVVSVDVDKRSGKVKQKKDKDD